MGSPGCVLKLVLGGRPWTSFNCASAVDTPFILKVQDFILYFTSILYEALPFIILGAVIAGFLEELLPQRLVARILPKSPTLSILVGGLLGIIFPMCECGIIPVMRRLLRKGFPLSCCVAYLLCGPVINVVVLSSTYAAFDGRERETELGGKLSYQMGGTPMVICRAVLAYIVAVVTAHVVEYIYRKHGNKLLLPLAVPQTSPKTKEEEDAEPPRPIGRRISAIAETALHDFIDITVFLIMGALLSAFVRQTISPQALAELSRNMPVLSILVMMGLAIVLCLCSEADAFVAASFATLRPASKVAFLVLGPMLDFKLYLMYTRVFRPRLIWTIFLSVIVLTFVLSFAVHLWWEHYAPLYWNEWYPPKPTSP